MHIMENNYMVLVLRKPRSFYSKRIFSFPIFSFHSRNSHLIIDAVSLWFSEPLDTKQEFSNSKLQAAFTVSSYRQPAKLNSSEGVAHALFSSPGENFKVKEINECTIFSGISLVQLLLDQSINL